MKECRGELRYTFLFVSSNFSQEECWTSTAKSWLSDRPKEENLLLLLHISSYVLMSFIVRFHAIHSATRQPPPHHLCRLIWFFPLIACYLYLGHSLWLTDNTKLPRFNNHLIKQCVHRPQITTCQSDNLNIWYAVQFGLTKGTDKGVGNQTNYTACFKVHSKSDLKVSVLFRNVPHFCPVTHQVCSSHTHPATDKVYSVSCTEMQLCFTTTD